MCETIMEYAPAYAAVVFSIELGRVSCFTEFDPVPKQTFIHHKWYRKDSLITEKTAHHQPTPLVFIHQHTAQGCRQRALAG